jgi:hypothetical protein
MKINYYYRDVDYTYTLFLVDNKQTNNIFTTLAPTTPFTMSGIIM